ncbi:kelch repeat-containing protein [Ancylobacter lacus]|uniref:kelch repeat-containing protein n=1 Tax=Ancylobacter lacus TaxID=2579970 RepID=UPI001BCFD421|nr:hypothetical protein [Ancylobacter lacus]MBS7539521.1 hypothetical protein [Ancylobacter lacus]
MTDPASITFALANAGTGEPVIYVTQDTSLNRLRFTLTYGGPAAATFRGGAPVPEAQITPQGPTSFYFTITPVLSPAEFAALKVTPPAGWRAVNLTSFALAPVADLTVSPGDSFVFEIDNVAADGQPGPGSFNVSNYNVPGVMDNGTQLALALERVPSLHKRLADVLSLSFVNGNSVYIDADGKGSIPSNTLVLRLDNISGKPLVPAGTPWTKTPVFFLSFVSATAKPGYGALTTVDRLKNVRAAPAADYGTKWVVDDQSAATPPYWALYPRSPEILGAGASALMDFRITDIVTDFWPSGTNLQIQSSEIPGYDDGVQALVIDKRSPTLAIQDFSAEANNVVSGTPVALNWRTFVANRCELSPVDGQTVAVPVQSAGTYKVSPAVTTTYTLTAYDDAGGRRTSQPLTIYVQPVRFTRQLVATPATGIHYGDRVALSWATSSATSCSVAPPLDGQSQVPPSSDGTIVHPAATVQYTLTAQGQNGPVHSTLTLVPIPNGWRKVADAGLWNSMGRPVLLPDFHDRLWFLAGGSGDGQSAVFRSIDGFVWEYATNQAAYSPRGEAAGCVFDGRMWLTGGRTRDRVVNEVWASSDGVNWTQMPAAGHWSPRSRHGCLAFGGRIWVMGGAGADGSPLADVWSSVDGVTWNQVTAEAPWTARSSFGTAVFGGAMVVVAGSSAAGPLADIWGSVDGRYWAGVGSTVPWPARRSPNVNVVDGRLYVVGGIGRDGMAISDSNILKADGRWGLGLGPGWSGDTLDLASAAFLGAQWFAGGTLGGQANRTVWGFG